MLFYQPIDGYRYNSDSIFLYDFVGRSNPSGKLLDIGSGCGVIGLLLARDFPVELHSVDKQESMAFLTQKNSEVNGIKAEVKKQNFLEESSTNIYDCIVSNPPFYHDDHPKSENPSIHTARYTEHLPIREMLANVRALLRNKGKFFFCYDCKQLPYVLVQLAENRLTVERLQFLHPKADREAKVFFCQVSKGSKTLMRAEPPLIVFEGEQYTLKAQEIFKKADTYTLRCQI